MKNILLLLFCLPVLASAQKTHTVAAKETLYSIGRLYNISPKELAAFNNLDANAGLNLGQTLKIPGTATEKPAANKSPKDIPPPITTEQIQKKDGNAAKVPVYHKVKKKESLYQISKQYKNVSVADLKKWNKLSSDALSEGATLIVGYQPRPLVKSPEPKPTPVEAKPAIISEVVIREKKDEPAEIRKPEVKEETKLPVTIEKAEDKPVPVETPKPKVTEPKTQPMVKSGGGNGGFFRSQYQPQAPVKEEKGAGAVFKSSSGWDDAKYYCLHNNAPAGTIIKIINSSNQRAIYAKVLDVIPDLKKNEGKLVCFSNAAASELGTTGEPIDVVVEY